MTAPSSGTPLPQRPAAANGTEFPTQRALGRRAFRSARRCPGAERGPQLRAQPPGTTAAAADAVPRAVLPNFRRLHEARSARGPARTSGRLPPGASFPAVIMLNTSLHNPNVRDKPTAERFVAMNRGINDGGDLPEELLRVGGA